MICSGTESKVRPTLMERESISSSVAAFESNSAGSERVAASSVGYSAIVVVLSFGTSTVRSTASAMNASVPSEATRRCMKMSSGES
ncbi:hypothetical protein B7L06_041020 [Burkholderia cenocepacia]|uniref:hypothetical protein n=1 Tax=Burkholderia cenocepacia TaxID=95486 RepID=UPI003899D24C|nr:hypothetical protein [Burkholderia cenocepacia]